MTREEVKQEFITKQPSINECEFCPNRGIRLWKCAEVHGCKWAQAMMEIAKMLESGSCDDAISRQAVLEVQIKYAEHMGGDKQMRDDIRALPPVTPLSEERTEERTGTHACDCISRQAVIDAIETDCSWDIFNEWGARTPTGERIIEAIKRVPSVEPEKCGDCISRQAAR